VSDPAALLEAALRHPAHAYLITGPPDGAAEAAALRLAGELCGVPDLGPGDVHPDVVQVWPEGTLIRIEQIEELWHTIQLRPLLAMRRAFVIWDADAMPEVVQHALLKAIEEPPPYAVVILVTSRPGILLPTVRSRVQTITFPARATVAGDPAADRYRALARAAYRDPAFDPGQAAHEVDRLGAELGARAAAGVEARKPPQEAKDVESRRWGRYYDDLARRRRRAVHVEAARAAADAAASLYRDLWAASLGATDTIGRAEAREELAEDARAPGAEAFAARGLEIARDTRRGLDLTVTPLLALESLFHRVWLAARETGFAPGVEARA
jgi:DNA polymerase-3 subunit delta'